MWKKILTASLLGVAAFCFGRVLGNTLLLSGPPKKLTEGPVINLVPNGVFPHEGEGRVMIEVTISDPDKQGHRTVTILDPAITKVVWERPERSKKP